MHSSIAVRFHAQWVESLQSQTVRIILMHGRATGKPLRAEQMRATMFVWVRLKKYFG